MPPYLPTPPGSPPSRPLTFEDPPTFSLQATHLQSDQEPGSESLMLLRVGNISPEDAADALNTADSSTTAFITAKELFNALPQELYYCIPVFSDLPAGTLSHFKEFIRKVALKGEDIDGKLSVLTQAAVLSSLALIHTQARVLQDRCELWQDRKEREENAEHYRNFDSDYGCEVSCHHTDHASQSNREEGSGESVPDSPISEQA